MVEPKRSWSDKREGFKLTMTELYHFLLGHSERCKGDNVLEIKSQGCK